MFHLFLPWRFPPLSRKTSLTPKVFSSYSTTYSIAPLPSRDYFSSSVQTAPGKLGPGFPYQSNGLFGFAHLYGYSLPLILSFSRQECYESCSYSRLPFRAPLFFFFLSSAFLLHLFTLSWWAEIPTWNKKKPKKQKTEIFEFVLNRTFYFESEKIVMYVRMFSLWWDIVKHRSFLESHFRVILHRSHYWCRIRSNLFQWIRVSYSLCKILENIMT